MPLASRWFFLPALGFGFLSLATHATAPDTDLHGAFRSAVKQGWIFVHLEGAPSEIGFEHGYLLAPEIEDAKRAIELSTTHGVNRSWAELRQVAEKYFWPKVPPEYRAELEGIEQGLKARGSQLDVQD